MPLTVACTNEQKVKITVNPVTAAGNPAAVDQLQVTPLSGDGTVGDTGEANSFFLVSGGAGPTVFRVTADSDLGAGVVPIEDTVTLDVTGALAANLGLTAGTPEPK